MLELLSLVLELVVPAPDLHGAERPPDPTPPT